MRHIAITALALMFAAHTAPQVLAAPAAVQAQGTGALNGTAQGSGGQTLGNYTVQLRNVADGSLVGSTTSTAAGNFSFVGLNPGSYVVEVVNAAGNVIGTSAVTAVTAGATVGVTVTAAAAAALTTAGGISTAVILTTVAAGAGLTGIVVAATQDEASPSQ